jgi:hypothetical protein
MKKGLNLALSVYENYLVKKQKTKRRRKWLSSQQYRLLTSFIGIGLVLGMTFFILNMIQKIFKK